MRDWIQADLASFRRGEIAAEFCGQGVGGFVAGGGKEKGYVEDEAAEQKLIRCQVHGVFRVEASDTESKLAGRQLSGRKARGRSQGSGTWIPAEVRGTLNLISVLAVFLGVRSKARLSCNRTNKDGLLAAHTLENCTKFARHPGRRRRAGIPQ